MLHDVRRDGSGEHLNTASDMKTHLIVIDPQNDFCDPKRGALYVKGADRDMQALAEFIARRGDLLDEIHVTLDSHQTIHVAHPIFWKNSQGEHPAPFTTLTRAEVEAGRWTTTNPRWMARGLGYVQALEKNHRYELMIWPPHCRIGTWGHSIFPCVSDALLAWEEKYFGKVNFLVKAATSSPNTTAPWWPTCRMTRMNRPSSTPSSSTL